MAKVTQQSFRLSEEMANDIDWIASLVAKSNGLVPNRTDGIRHAAAFIRRTAMPMVGELGAGPPRHSPADDDFLRVYQMYPSDSVVYRVKGTSMEDELIGDGDFVVVKPQRDADHGAVVVAYIAENGCVVKRYDKNKGQLFSGTGKGRWVHKLTDDDKILGVLVGVIRKT